MIAILSAFSLWGASVGWDNQPSPPPPPDASEYVPPTSRSVEEKGSCGEYRYRLVRNVHTRLGTGDQELIAHTRFVAYDVFRNDQAVKVQAEVPVFEFGDSVLFSKIACVPGRALTLQHYFTDIKGRYLVYQTDVFGDGMVTSQERHLLDYVGDLRVEPKADTDAAQ
jgi:hypothetical protein